MNVAAPVIFAVFGLVFGSFVNALVNRLPNRMSLVSPPSACPRCGTPIRARDNVPVISYLMLRGRCHACGERTSLEYPLVEAGTAGLFVLAAIRLPVGPASIVAPFLGVMLAVALIDARHRIVPNRLIYPSLILFAIAVVVAAAADVPVSPIRALLGLLAFGGTLLIVALISPRGMGIGDVKLAALIGLVLGSLGWKYVAVAAVSGTLLGGLGGVAALLAGRGRKETIPFGPYLAAGAVVAALFAGSIAAWYGGRLA
jgi:leader peptidase (prepilin peptidase)/N-methyltransferase